MALPLEPMWLTLRPFNVTVGKIFFVYTARSVTNGNRRDKKRQRNGLFWINKRLNCNASTLQQVCQYVQQPFNAASLKCTTALPAKYNMDEPSAQSYNIHTYVYIFFSVQLKLFSGSASGSLAWVKHTKQRTERKVKASVMQAGR